MGGEEGWELQDGVGRRGFGVFGAGHFQGGPAGVGMIRSKGNVADEAAPFDEGSLDIAGAQ